MPKKLIVLLFSYSGDFSRNSLFLLGHHVHYYRYLKTVFSCTTYVVSVASARPISAIPPSLYVTSEVMFGGNNEGADGIWVDAAVWYAYRDLCSREKLRPAEPIEKFLNFILRGGSALSVLNWLKKANPSK